MILTYYDKLKNSMCYLNIEKNKVTQFDASPLPKIICDTNDGITYEPTNKDSNIVTPTTSDINNQYNYNQIVFIPKATNKTNEPLLLLNNKSVPIRIRPRGFYEERGVATSLLEKTAHISPNALIKDIPYILTFCGECWLVDSMLDLYPEAVTRDTVEAMIAEAIGDTASAFAAMDGVIGGADA